MMMSFGVGTSIGAAAFDGGASAFRGISLFAVTGLDIVRLLPIDDDVNGADDDDNEDNRSGVGFTVFDNASVFATGDDPNNEFVE
jgi:hypothetical protein